MDEMRHSRTLKLEAQSSERFQKNFVFLVVQAEDFKPVGQQVLDAFHKWIEAGAAGASNWKLAEVNHEGWRVS